jgi:hypothetical protein
MPDEPARHRPRVLTSEKTIRIDPDPAAERSPRDRPEDTGLLDQFRSWIAATPRENRRAARHAARTHIIWAGWWRGEDEFFALPARLANIGRGGALIFVEHPPPEAHSLWICLGTPEPDESIAATVLEVRRARRTECAVRVAFHKPCPPRFLEAAICGRTSGRSEIRQSGT